MRNLFTAARVRAFSLAVLFLGSAASSLWAQERFALAPGNHNDLVVYGPQGQLVGDFPAPTISQPVTIAGVASFEISFGRDVNDLLTAILAPNPQQPSALHFTILTKRVDADEQAVVTLTFAPSLKKVTIDPGYIGVVQVDSQTLTRHAQAADTALAAPPATHPSAPAEATPHVVPASTASTTDSGSDNPVGRAVQPTTIRLAEPVSVSTTQAQPRLFWAEPVTSPDGSTPAVAPNEMKLVSVHGSVSVKMPDGSVQHGANGMLIPSGTAITTAPGSSAAVFSGGVNSERLLPDSGMVVNQTMEGTVRHTTVDLQKGSVFARVGKRPGETQKYEVRTPDGVAAARGTEYAVTLVDGVTLVFVNSSTVELYVNGALVETVTGRHGHINHGSMGQPTPSEAEFSRVLNEVLTELQPFNTTMIKALFDYESGTATASEKALIEAALIGSLDVSDNGNIGYFLQQGNAPVPVNFNSLFTPQGQTVAQFFTQADEGTDSTQVPPTLPPAH
jgi:hypothetical protein